MKENKLKKINMLTVFSFSFKEFRKANFTITYKPNILY